MNRPAPPVPLPKQDFLTAFLPVRGQSQRVPRKSTRPFAGVEGGLLTIKLRQLTEVPEFDAIVLSSEDEGILETGSRQNDPRLRLIHRDPSLSRDATTCGEIIRHAAECIPDGHILWTHVTSPFIGSDRYREAIRAYWEGFEKGYDSLMTGLPIRKYLWNAEGPLNYAPAATDPWPRTQTLEPAYLVDSGIFLGARAFYVGEGTEDERCDRIGSKPQWLESSPLEAFDLDTEEEFALAESVWNAQSKIREPWI